MLTKVAKKLDLDVAQLKKDADSKDVRVQLEETATLARSLGISGTPAFIINDKLSPGYIGYETMEAEIKNARDEQG